MQHVMASLPGAASGSYAIAVESCGPAVEQLEVCTCSRRRYDSDRRRCVEHVCSAADLPDGVLGGAYFARANNIWKDAGTATCRTVDGRWTPWLNRDSPSGSGDFETLREFVNARQVCASPFSIQCQTTDGRDWQTTGQAYTCDPTVGGVCQNKEQRCVDYRVRFFCPP